MLGVEKIWQRHTKGEGVVVAVIDTGVHPGGDLKGAVLPGSGADGSGRGDVGEDTEYHAPPSPPRSRAGGPAPE